VFLGGLLGLQLHLRLEEGDQLLHLLLAQLQRLGLLLLLGLLLQDLVNQLQQDWV